MLKIVKKNNFQQYFVDRDSKKYDKMTTADNSFCKRTPCFKTARGLSYEKLYTNGFDEIKARNIFSHYNSKYRKSSNRAASHRRGIRRFQPIHRKLRRVFF